MKKHQGLIIANGVLIALYGLFYLIVGMVDLIQIFNYENVWGIQLMFQYLFKLFFLATTALMAFFVRKFKTFIVPVCIFGIYEWGLSSVGLVSYIAYPGRYSWVNIPTFIFLTAILIVTIIEFVFAKPFSKADDVEEVTEEKAKVSLDDIQKAKELLNAGAITNEEFYEIKRKAIR